METLTTGSYDKIIKLPSVLYSNKALLSLQPDVLVVYGVFLYLQCSVVSVTIDI